MVRPLFSSGPQVTCPQKTRRLTSNADFLQLARIALSGRTQDVQVILRRAAKRYHPLVPRFADALTALLHESPTAASPLRRQADVPLPVDIDSRLHLMRVETEPVLEHEPVFAPALAASLQQIVEERRNPLTLVRAGLDPTRTALFVGPPGRRQDDGCAMASEGTQASASHSRPCCRHEQLPWPHRQQSLPCARIRQDN